MSGPYIIVYQTEAGAKAALAYALSQGGLHKSYEYTIEKHEVRP